MKSPYPVQIQADMQDANDSFAVCMVHVFDIKSQICALSALQKVYTHVVAWDVDGNKVDEYDNR